MHGWLKQAREHWPKCVVQESDNAMDVREEGSHDLLVSARRNGAGSMHCAQKETGAKFPLSVLQTPSNLEEHKAREARKAARAAQE